MMVGLAVAVVSIGIILFFALLENQELEKMPKTRAQQLTGLEKHLVEAAQASRVDGYVTRVLTTCAHCHQKLTPETTSLRFSVFCLPCLESHRVPACHDPDCALCAVLVCPHGDYLHFTADGCPSCFPKERQ